MKKSIPQIRRPRYHFVLPLQDKDVQVYGDVHAELDLLTAGTIEDKSEKITRGMAFAQCEDYRKQAQIQSPGREIANDYRRFCALFIAAYLETRIACIARYREDPQSFIVGVAARAADGHTPTYERLREHYRATRALADLEV